MPNYIVIGGGAYQPGSAAAKKAQQLYDAMPRTPVTPAVPSPSVPTGTAPTNFPSYLPKGGSTTTSSSLLGAGGATLAPGPSVSGQGAFGLVPTMPNPVSTAAGSIAGNQANLPGLSALATDTTKLNAGLGALPYQMNLPNYGGMLSSASQGITSNLAGVIDPQEWTQLQQRMAERGARVGISPGSPNFNTALMTALDQSIAGRQALGQQQLTGAIARTPTGQPFNVAGQQISPEQMQQAQWIANTLGAAPDPTQAAQANLDMLLKAIAAGRQGGLGGMGGGGGGFMPPRTVTTPGAPYPVGGYGGGYGGGYAGPSYGQGYAPTAPGTAPTAPTGLSPYGPYADQYQFPPGSPGYESPPGFTGVGQDWMGVPGFADTGGEDWLQQFLDDWEQGA